MEKQAKKSSKGTFSSRFYKFKVRKGEVSTHLGYTSDAKLIMLSNVSLFGTDYHTHYKLVSRFYGNFVYVMYSNGFTKRSMVEWIRLKTGVKFSVARLNDLLWTPVYAGFNAIEFMYSISLFLNRDFIEMLSVDYSMFPPANLLPVEHGKMWAAKSFRYRDNPREGNRKPPRLDFFINPWSLRNAREAEIKALKCCPACGRSVASEGEAVYLSELVMEMDFQDPNWRLTADEIIENDILKKADAIRKKRGLPAK